MPIIANPGLNAAQPQDKVLPKGKRADLIEQIADTLHAVKAYDLPAVCKRLGLSGGPEVRRTPVSASMCEAGYKH